MIFPVDRDRNKRRSSRYSWPRMRASRTVDRPPLAFSYSNSPSSTQIVELNEDRLLGGASQFQPPSSSCSLRSRSTSRPLASPKYAPQATTHPLIQGSTSPSKKSVLLISGPQVLFSQARRIAFRACALAGSSPNSLYSARVSMVEAHRWDTQPPPPQFPSRAWRL